MGAAQGSHAAGSPGACGCKTAAYCGYHRTSPGPVQRLMTSVMMRLKTRGSTFVVSSSYALQAVHRQVTHASHDRLLHQTLCKSLALTRRHSHHSAANYRVAIDQGCAIARCHRPSLHGVHTHVSSQPSTPLAMHHRSWTALVTHAAKQLFTCAVPSHQINLIVSTCAEVAGTTY